MSKQKLISSLLAYIFFIIPFISQAQEEGDPIRCQVDHWLEQKMKDPNFAREFNQKEAYYRTNASQRTPDCSNPIVLPIAIHWSGNIQDVPCLLDMAVNQIEVLNQDFGGYNPDITNYCDDAFDCPEHYALDAISGGSCIQFCLATMDHPAGSGLNDGDPAFTFNQWTFDTDAPPWDGYVNIFVSDQSPSGYGSGLLGLAPLFGGANPDGNGVFVAARAFGGYEEECDAGPVTINNSNNYDLGRTATHELGHYYGLRHTFQGCGSGDQIADTPSQDEPNYGVPTIGSDCLSTANNTCGTQDFFFNYMDYGNDVVMYMFTSDQSDLMYDVALDGNYKSETSTCQDIPNDYDPIFPTGCYVCPSLSIVASTVETTCYGDCDGAITIEDVPAGIPPFTYVWDNGESTATIENLCAGDYTVSVYDAYNCEVIEEFTVNEPDELIANAFSTDEMGNEFEDGTAWAEPFGGTDPYFYSWSNGENTQAIENLAPGSYTVTVMDFNGCESIQSVIVEEFICPALTVIDDHSDVLCAGECTGAAEISDVLNSEAPLVYEWSNGGVDPVITDLCAGVYLVTITDVVNCSIVADTFFILEPEELIISTDATHETGDDTNDGTASVTPDGGTPPYEFLWSNDETTQTITNLSPGTYTVTVTDANGCEKEDMAVVEEYDCPNLETQSYTEDISCFGECTGLIEIIDLLNGIPPFTYTWSNGEESAIIEDLCAGKYYVTISDDAGCNKRDSFELFESPLLSALISATDETAFEANDGTAKIEVSGGSGSYIYLWSNGEQGASIDDLSPGEYTCTITDENECSIVESVIVEAFICPDLELIHEQVDLNCFEICEGSLNISDISNGTEPYAYSWSNESLESTINDLCAESYSVTVTDAFNCSVSASFELTQPEQLLANATAIGESFFQSNDGSATCNPNGGTPPYTFEWSTGAISQTIDNLEPGNYSVTITDANSCLVIESIVVEEFVCPDLVIDSEISNSSCFGDCDGSIYIATENGTEPYIYVWSNGATTQNLEGLCAGEYNVTITDDKNCSVKQTFFVEEPEEMIITIVNVVDVQNGEAGSIDISVNGDYTFDWRGDDGFKSEEEDLIDLGEGCYTLIVTDPETECTVDTTICIEDFTSTFDWAESRIRIYPNPVDEKLTLDFSNVSGKITSIQLLDWKGVLIDATNNRERNNKVTLNTKPISPGVYLIRIEKDGVFYNKKVAIVH